MLAAVVLILTPWTGPSLPTAATHADRFRLAVHGAAAQTVRLHVAGVPPGWIASFCTRTLCSPMRYELRLNRRGVGMLEFQALRLDPAAPTSARIQVLAPNARPVSANVRA